MSFNNMGKPVPDSRKAKATDYFKSVVGSKLKQDIHEHVINKTAKYLEQDNPFHAMQYLGSYIDLTGSYIIMSYLLTD